MADHLVIGILIGMASGILALIVISALTLRQLDSVRRIEATRVHRALMDLQRSVRQDIAAARREFETLTRDARDESADGARALRDEITGGLKGASDAFARGLAELASIQQRRSDALAERLSGLTEAAVTALGDHPMPAVTRLAEAQERQLGGLAAELQNLANDTRALLDQRLRQVQAENRDRLEQLRGEGLGHARDLRNEVVEALRAHTDTIGARMDAFARAAIDETLERTLEHRLGEHFTLVSERLQLVSDRLEEVAFVAARGKRKRMAEDRNGHGTVEAPPVLSS